MNSYDYQKYLQSAHWRAIKRDYAKQFKRICYLCASVDNLELHHVTYERIGAELLTDLAYLCENCHGFIHQDTQEARDLRAWIDPVLRPAQGVHDKNVLWGKAQETKPVAPIAKETKPLVSSKNRKQAWLRDRQVVITIGFYKDAYSITSGGDILTKRAAGESTERTLLLAILEAERFVKTNKATAKAKKYGIRIELQDKSTVSCLQEIKNLKARGWRLNNGYKLQNTDLWERVLALCLRESISFDRSKVTTSTHEQQVRATSVATEYWKSQVLSDKRLLLS